MSPIVSEHTTYHWYCPNCDSSSEDFDAEHWAIADAAEHECEVRDA